LAKRLGASHKGLKEVSDDIGGSGMEKKKSTAEPSWRPNRKRLMQEKYRGVTNLSRKCKKSSGEKKGKNACN